MGRVRRWRRRRWRRRRVQLISWKGRCQVWAALIAAASALLQRDRLVSRGQRHAGSLPHGEVLPGESFICRNWPSINAVECEAPPPPLQWLLTDSCSWQVLWLWHNIRADGRLAFKHFVKHLTSDLGGQGPLLDAQILQGSLWKRVWRATLPRPWWRSTCLSGTSVRRVSHARVCRGERAGLYSRRIPGINRSCRAWYTCIRNLVITRKPQQAGPIGA